MTQEADNFVELPMVRQVDAAEINKVDGQIKLDVQQFADEVFERIMSEQGLEYLFIKNSCFFLCDIRY